MASGRSVQRTASRKSRRRLLLESLESRHLLASVSGTVWNDANADGIRDAGDAGLPSATVYVDANRNGARDGGEPFTTSAADGAYTIDNLLAGNFLVRVETTSQTVMTSPITQTERLFVSSGTTIREINPTTGAELNSFSASPVLTRGAVSGGLAFDGTSVFLIDRIDNRILVFDPATGALTSSLGPLPTGFYGGLAYVNSLLYASDNTNERIHAINPTTGAVVSTFNIAALNAGTNFHPGPIDLLEGLGESADGTRLLAGTASLKRLIINPATGIVEGAYTDATNQRDLGIAGGTGRIFIGRRDTSSIDVYDAAGIQTATLPNVTVADDVAAGLISTVGASVTLTSFQQATGIDLGIGSSVGNISGYQFIDANSNGTFDAGESPLAGVTVYVDANNNRSVDSGERSAISAADGSYTITNVPRGTRTVRTISAPGFESAAVQSVNEQLYGVKPRLSTFPTEVSIYRIDPQTGAQIDLFTTPFQVSDVLSAGFDGDRFYLIDNVQDLLIQTTSTGTFLSSTSLPGTGTSRFALGVAIVGGVVYVPMTGGGSPIQLWRFDPQSNQFASSVPISTNTNQLAGQTYLPSLSPTVSESPDGRSILLFSSVSGDPRVFVVNPLTGRIDTVFDMPDSAGGDFAAAVYGGEFYLRSIGTSSTLRVYNSSYVLQRTISTNSYSGLASGFVRDRGTTVALASAVVSGINVPHRSITTVSGRVSIDFNQNGVVDPGEAKSGETVYVDVNRNGLLDAGEPTTVSAADGTYSFLGLPIGDHAIRMVSAPSQPIRTQQNETSLYGLKVIGGVSTIFKHDVLTGLVLREFAAPGVSTVAAGLAINQHGLYYSSSGGIWRLNPEDGTVLNNFSTAGATYDGLASLGGFLFAVNSATDSIVKLDSLTGQVISSFNVINTTNGLPFDLLGGLGESTSGAHLIANVGNFGPLVVFDPNTGAEVARINSSAVYGLAGAGGELFRGIVGTGAIGVDTLPNNAPVTIRSLPVGYSPYGLAAAVLPSKEYVVRSGHQPAYTNLDFQIDSPAEPGSVAGRAYRDNNGNGIQDEGEPGLAAIQVYVDWNSNDVHDLGEPIELTSPDDPATTEIDETGQYSFDGIAPGHFIVRQVTQAGYEITALISTVVATTDRYNSNFAFVPFQHHPDDDIRLSATGRYLVYATTRAVLPADTNTRRDIYQVDRQTGIHELISINDAGQFGSSNHFEPDVSADGRYVTFRTGSTNYDARDTNGTHDIYIRDRQLGTTTLLTVGLTGSVGAGGHTADAVITPDGQNVLLYSAGPNLRADDTNGSRDTFVWNRTTGMFDRVSLSSGGAQLTDGDSYGGDISPDGRYVVFESSSSQVTAGDTNGVSDLYWKDRSTGEVRLVSASSTGVRGDERSQKRSISDDGRWVAFDSLASNLTSDPHPGPGLAYQVYLKDMETGAIVSISQATGPGTSVINAQRPEISGDGRYIVFESDSALVASDTNGLVDVYLYDRVNDSLQLVSRADAGGAANGPSNNPVISSDGTTIAYTTAASNIGGITSVGGIVVARIESIVGGHVVELTSGANLTDLDFANSPIIGSISGTQFYDANSNAVLDAGDVRLPGRTVYVDLNRNGQLDAGEPSAVSQSDDPETPADETGYYVIDGVPGAPQQVRQVLPVGWEQTLPQPPAPSATLASINNYQPGVNTPAIPRFGSALSETGRFVAFSTDSQLLPIDVNPIHDIYVLDRQTDQLELVSLTETGDLTSGYNFNPNISSDGRYVAFQSFGSNLVPGDTNGQADVFVRDRMLGTTVLISRSLDVPGRTSSTGSSYSYKPKFSGDGRYLIFWSNANNLVADDTNGVFDLFSITLATGVIERISKGFDGSQAIGGNTNQGVMSYDGRFIAFQSLATNLVPDDTNNSPDIFVYDRTTGMTERISTTAEGEQGTDQSFDASISSDGRYVAFKSRSGNFVGSPDSVAHQIFLKDRTTGSLTLVTRDQNGGVPNSFANNPAISGDGRWIVYDSPSGNMAPGDNNGLRDVFLYDVLNGTTQLISRDADGIVGNGTSEYPAMSRDGSTITFLSDSSNFAGQSIGGLYEFVNSAVPSSAVNVTVANLQETPDVLFASRPVAPEPTDITPSATSINENINTSAADVLFAELAVTDETPGDTHTLALVPGDGNTDNDRFVIMGSQLLLKQNQVVDFETKPTYTIRVRATDQGGLTFEKQLTLGVNDLLELAPTGQANNGITIANGTSQRSRVESLSIDFGSPVVVETGAFTLVNLSDPTKIVNVTASVAPNGTTVNLAFAGSSVEAFGSLRDGNYRLTIHESLIHDGAGNYLDANKDGATNGQMNRDFFRLYGDSDGNREVGFSDFLGFRASYGQANVSAARLAAFDLNHSGRIDFYDFLAFRANYGKKLLV